ncbi:alpha/beta hydrolase [Parasphingopyxis algicola]|uniref:alpha/beta fold hydrolase n=1 Tax=Parasphingopyxis algicola TaxID=2026624 RepID=UPI0015A1A74A|nr:alpha/beta hydrolase [Parasphingopyxis algicola]QLC24870.1 alpha/beta hydrolase [Parasphingopyxis algicola]
MTELGVAMRIPVQGGNLFAVEIGSGPETVLLLHGWPQTHREWLPLANLLSDEMRLIMPDLRGCGESLKAYDGYDAATLADDVLAVLDYCDVDRAHIVAHDIGGGSAYAFAHLHQDRAASLTLFETPLWGVTSEDVPHLPDLFWHLRFHSEVDLAAALIGSNLPLYLDHFFSDFAFDARAIPADDRAAYVRSYAASGALRASLMHYQAIPKLSEQFASFSNMKLDLPVQAYGSEAVMGEYVVKAARLVARQVEGGVIETCGHWIPEERPEAAARIIRESIAMAAHHRKIEKKPK